MNIQKLTYVIREIAASAIIALLIPLLILQAIRLTEQPLRNCRAEQSTLNQTIYRLASDIRNKEQKATSPQDTFKLQELDKLASQFETYFRNLKTDIQTTIQQYSPPTKALDQDQDITPLKKQHEEAKASYDALEAQCITLEKQYDGRIFYTSLIVGTLAIILGIILAIASLGTGLILGGGIAIVIGYLYNLKYLSDLFLFISLLIAFFAIVLGLWFYTRKKRDSEKLSPFNHSNMF